MTKTNNTILQSPRTFGKRLDGLLSFYEEGIKGKSAIYSTPQGDFLSPKAVEQALSQGKEDDRERIYEALKRQAQQCLPEELEGAKMSYNRLSVEVIKKVINNYYE